MKQVILITGASSGIGKATAKYFAAHDWNVIATMRSPEKETELSQLSNVFVVKLDVQDPSTIDAALKSGINHFGHIDALINNAGYGQAGVFESVPPEQVVKQFDVNVFGVMNTIRAILPYFRQRGKGMILNISSGAGQFTLPTLSLYNSSKYALEGFSEALSYELSPLHIKVKIVEPGGTETNFNATTANEASGNLQLDDYKPFLASAGKLFEGMIAARLATVEKVAEVIFTAVTDGKDTFRYVIGNEEFTARMKARKEMSDQEYIDHMHERITQNLPQ